MATGYIDSNGNRHIISGMVTGERPKYTMAEYTALTDKPIDWICTDYDATSEYGINDTEVKHGNTTVNAMLTKKEIAKLLIPEGSIRLTGIITQNAGGTFMIICALPISPYGAMTFTSSEFRPAGQTAVKETSPSFTLTEGNNVIVTTNNSNSAGYVGKQGICDAVITYL